MLLDAKTDSVEAGHKKHQRSPRTLSRDLIVGVIFAVVVVFAVVVSLAYGYLAHKASVQRAGALSEFSDYLHHSLELPIWNIDEEGINKICNSFFENALVRQLTVTDLDGSVFFKKSRGEADPDDIKQIPIMHGSALVGHVHIALNPDVFKENQRQLMWLGVITLSVVIVILTVVLRLVLNVFLISPLQQLIQHTEQITRGEYETVELTPPQQEIRTIMSRFNRMVDRIKRRERSFKAVNQRLEKEIIDHRDAESALLNSQEELDSIIRSTPDIIYRLDTVGRFTFVSDAIRRYGLTPDDLLGQSFLDHIHDEDKAAARHQINACRTDGDNARRMTVHAFGQVSRTGDSVDERDEPNSVFLMDAEGLFVSGESGVRVFVGIQGIARDITRQRQMETARMESEHRLLLALDVSGAGVWQLNLKTGAILVDDRIYALLGYSPADLVDGLRFMREKVATGSWKAIQDNFRRHVTGDAPMFDHEIRLQSSQGQWKWFHTKAKVVHVDKDGSPEIMVGIVVDTSDRKESEAERERLEMKLQQAQKMEAIGTLAGGIAHDFNNILGAIFGYAQLTQMHAVDNAKIQGYVENIFKASERAKGLVEQILTFTRQGKSRKLPGDIAIVLKEVVKLIRATIPSTITITQKIPTQLGTVMADQTQIHQVLMNLCTNAAHSMDADGGELTVALEECHVKTNAVAHAEDLPPGRYLRLSVKDTGNGMEKAVLDRIFDPYFTTKSVGEGTGMGLATVHGIISDHDGRITVESVPGQGSVFKILFPVLEDQTETAAIETLDFPRGSESVLFVDDEELLVEVGVEMLGDLGYDAVGSTRPADALEMVAAEPDRFDLVITDMTMPGMTGDQLAQRIRGHRPEMPVILCTGFNKRISAEQVSTLGLQALVMKPFTAQELSQTIRDTLDRTAAGGLPNPAST